MHTLRTIQLIDCDKKYNKLGSEIYLCPQRNKDPNKVISSVKGKKKDNLLQIGLLLPTVNESGNDFFFVQMGLLYNGFYYSGNCILNGTDGLLEGAFLTSCLLIGRNLSHRRYMPCPTWNRSNHIPVC